ASSPASRGRAHSPRTLHEPDRGAVDRRAPARKPAPGLLDHTRKWLGSRLRWIGAFAVVAIVLRVASLSPPEPTEAGVAEMLAEAIDGQVEPDAFVWEPSGGSIEDVVLGRHVLFLGSTGDARDLYRARVRVSREGKPIAARAL